MNKASGLELHQFKWTHDIGQIPGEGNHLVGEYGPNPNAKLVHFTLGTPCFKAYRACEYAKEWFDEEHNMLRYDKRGEFSLPAKEPDCRVAQA